MTTRNSNTPSELAETIRRRLERSAEAAEAPPAADPTGTLRATKTGELIAPGEEVPKGPDGQPVAHMQIPDATFHTARVFRCARS